LGSEHERESYRVDSQTAERRFYEEKAAGGTMKYLLLARVDEKKIEALSRNESQQLDDDSLAYDDTLRKGGHLIAAQALQFSSAAAIVRVQQGKAMITDGPFVETKEQVGGFILIEAGDMNEAIQLASKIPVARFGAIEVREIKELVRRKTRKFGDPHGTLPLSKADS
jgi:hypothetical protein